MKYYKENINIWLIFPDESLQEVISTYAPDILLDDEFLDDGLHDVGEYEYEILLKSGIISESEAKA